MLISWITQQIISEIPINMPDNTHHTHLDVILSYKKNKRDDEIRGEWGAVVLYRWISLMVTPWFLKISISATTVTLLSLILTLCIPLTLLFDNALSYLYMSILGIIICILDCIDGNIARVTNTVTRLGHYMDFIVDILYRIIIYITLGLIVYKTPTFYSFDSILPLLLATLAALMAISARMSRIYVENRLSIHAYGAQDSHSQDKIAGNYTNKIFSFVSGLDSLLPVFIMIAGAFGKLHWFLVWIFLYSALDFLYTQFSIMRQLK